MSENPPEAISPLPCDDFWPVDWSCYGPPEQVDQIDPEVRTRAEALAVLSLQALTLGQVGGCPVTVRPCAQRCMAAAFGGTWMTPHLREGRWYNACGCASGCACDQVPTLLLPLSVGQVVQVKQDGVVLEASAYRLDNGHELVRRDGSGWPLCQRMDADDDEVGTLSVTYRVVPVDTLASYVAGLLAMEFLKACDGQECALPRNVVGITRQGVSIELSGDIWPNNRTGIDAVDAWLWRWNPYRVSTPSIISSPDAPAPRRVG